MATSTNLAAKFHSDVQSLSGKRVVITGGTTGLGRAIAVLLVANGARVLIFGRDPHHLRDALGDLTPLGEAHGLTADAGNADDVKRVFAEADRLLGGVDVLINNAAIGGGSTLKTDYAQWEERIRINVLGYMACGREAVGRMRNAGGGTIINIGSMSAEEKGGGNDVYVTAKTALRGYSDSLMKSVNAENIRVTLIEPGLVGSDMVKFHEVQQKQMQSDAAMLKAEEIAECVKYVLTAPQRCHIDFLQIRPTKQEI